MMQPNDVVNEALLNLGTSLFIQDISTDQSNQARIIRRMLRSSLDASLEKHPWRFAMSAQALPLLGEYLSPDWKFSYSLPADCLILRELGPNGSFSKVELYEQNKHRWEEVYSTGSPRIDTDVPEAWGKYTVRILETNAVPSHFGRAWAAMLAMKIAPALMGDKAGGTLQGLSGKLDEKFWMEVANDEGRAPQKLDAPNPYIQARYSC
jgi:hypothetical protein